MQFQGWVTEDGAKKLTALANLDLDKLRTSAQQKSFPQHPTVPAGRIAANINADSINKWGRTSDVAMLGLGKSSLDAVVREVAAEQGRSVHGDPFPDRGAFYRSDQFELARVGVPVVYARGGPNFIGRPLGRAQQLQVQVEG